MKTQEIVYVTVIVLFFLGCVKTSNPGGSASFNIVNAVNLSNPLVTNFTPLNGKSGTEEPLQYYANANQISYGSCYESGSYLGMTFLSISQISDTSANIWSGEFNLAVGSVHSLFLMGDTISVDTLFTTDVVPYYPPGDSVAGLRFINLTQNSLPMAVNIQGAPPSQTEFVNLGYKQVSAFKSYSANSGVPGYYTFEIRAQASDSLLLTYTWNYQVFKNQTIVIAGSATNLNAPINSITMNNY